MTNEQFMQSIYQAVLNRSGDTEGLKYWTNTLNAGIHTRDSVIRAFTSAPEVQKKLRARVEDAYRNILGRIGDQAGINYWVGRLSDGTLIPSADVIAAQFRGSDEYKANGGQDRVYDPGTTMRTRDPIIEYAPDAQGDGSIENPTSGPTSPGVNQPVVVPPTNKASMSAEFAMILGRYNLESLAPWVIDKLTDGASEGEIIIDLYEQPAFKERFPGLDIQRENGIPVMSPEQYLQYERDGIALMRAAGMPSGFYDQPSDFTDLIGKNVSMAELGARVQNVYLQVTQSPPEVRAEYAAFFGINGEAALAAQILDPDKALPALERMVATAEIAGFGDVFGVNVSEQRAARLAELGYNGTNVQSGYRNIQGQRALFRETITETEDLTAEGEGVDAAFGLNQDSVDTINRRSATRRNNLSGGGGLALSQEGLAGRADS